MKENHKKIDIFKIKKISLILFFICLFIFFYEHFNAKQAFQSVIKFITDASYRNRYLLGLTDADVKINGFFDFFIYSFFDYPSFTRLDYTIIFGTRLFQVLVPFIPILLVDKFYNYSRNLYLFSKNRIKSNFLHHLKLINSLSLKIALAVFLAYFIFLIYCQMVSFPINPITKGSPTRELFLEILGTDFYFNNMFLYFTLEGFVRFFIIPYIYSFLGCSLCFVVKNKKLALFLPSIYYFGFTLISFGLAFFDNFIGKISYYFSPATIMVSGGFNNVNSLALIISGFLPIFIAIIILYLNFKYYDKV